MHSLRLLFSALRLSAKPVLNQSINVISATRTLPLVSVAPRNYTTILQSQVGFNRIGLLSHPGLVQIGEKINSRTVTKFSIRKGKRKTVKTVTKRFYRLHWGGWIRTIAGRHRRLYRKRPKRRLWVKQHVLCNSTQSTLLNKMVNNYWRKPKYYVDDPYEPYHTREEYKYTYTKPRPYFPPDE